MVEERHSTRKLHEKRPAMTVSPTKAGSTGKPMKSYFNAAQAKAETGGGAAREPISLLEQLRDKLSFNGMEYQGNDVPTDQDYVQVVVVLRPRILLHDRGRCNS